MGTLGLFSLLNVLLVIIVPNLVNGVNNSHCPMKLREATKSDGVTAVLEKHETALLMMLGFGGFSIILALLHNAVRKHFYHDEHNLDTTFDAGGNVSLSLTAVTVASQLFWPGDILHSATLTTKNGIAGPFWYSAGIMANIFVFPVLSVHFKTRAPGAKTYLQIMYARFGKTAHKVFCCFALLTNLVITVGVLLAGRATIQSLTKHASDEFSVLIMATLFGSYSLIGGLGTTFYVSYFNAVLVFVLLIVFVVKILHNTDSEFENIGNTEKMYSAIVCLHGPEDSEQNSYLTFRSFPAFLYGVIEVFVSSAVTYCDQASWQSRIAAKPVQGVWGFILAGFVWFSIPSTMATTTGMAYLAISATNGSHILTRGEIDEGLVTPLIAEKILGSAGGILVLTMGAMALMSTGSGEVMAISSIIVYDIYQTYIQPFRRNLESIHCLLCGRTKKSLKKSQGEENTAEEYCSCIDVTKCEDCSRDMKPQKDVNFSDKKHYKCTTHGRYREYRDLLFEFKNWCIVWVTIAIIPLGLATFESGIDLNWMFYSGAIVTIPCFPPVLLSIMWVKATGIGLIIGSLSGLVCGISATLLTASFYEGGLSKFLLNTAQDYALLAGTSTSFGISLTVCVIASYLTHNIKTQEDENVEWLKMYDIDNPISPWELNFRDDFKGVEYDVRPSVEQMNTAFRKAKLCAYIGGACSIALFTLIIPSIMASFSVMDQTQFSMWLTFTQAWAVIMAIIVIVAPPAEEISRIVKQLNKNKGLQLHVLKMSNQESHELVVKDNEHIVNNEPTHV